MEQGASFTLGFMNKMNVSLYCLVYRADLTEKTCLLIIWSKKTCISKKKVSKKSGNLFSSVAEVCTPQNALKK